MVRSGPASAEANFPRRIDKLPLRREGGSARILIDEKERLMTAQELLSAIIDHFADAKETPGDCWAPCDDHTSYSLDHRSRDGTKFWIDLDKSGEITLLWKPPGLGTPIIKTFKSE